MYMLITYHNENTNKAIWLTNGYCFESTDRGKYNVMKQTNELLRDPYHTADVYEGILLMLEYDGEPI